MVRIDRTVLCSFKAGDTIVILDKDESGWWHGELNGYVIKCAARVVCAW